MMSMLASQLGSMGPAMHSEWRYFWFSFLGFNFVIFWSVSQGIQVFFLFLYFYKLRKGPKNKQDHIENLSNKTKYKETKIKFWYKRKSRLIDFVVNVVVVNFVLLL
jgi:uncharacterized ion transporter superfamily protein YfcC